MKKNNIELIDFFLSSKENGTLLINQVNEEIFCFYDFVIKDMAINYNISLKYNNKFDVDISDELFSNRKIFVFNLSNLKDIKKIIYENFQKIIFTDYKNYKKFAKIYVSINGYDFEKDMKIFLKDHLKISDQRLIEYCISQPHLTFSEISKYNINKNNYIIGSPATNEENFIFEIRKDIFKLKRSQTDVKKLFSKIKKEAKYKKFNFLIY